MPRGAGGLKRTKSNNSGCSNWFASIHPVHLELPLEMKFFLASFESWKFLESIWICFQGQHPACRSRRHQAKWGRRPSVSGLKLKCDVVEIMLDYVGSTYSLGWSILWMLSFLSNICMTPGVRAGIIFLSLPEFVQAMFSDVLDWTIYIPLLIDSLLLKNRHCLTWKSTTTLPEESLPVDSSGLTFT